MPVFDDSPTVLTLTPAERQELEAAVKSRHSRLATVLRARIILYRADGSTPEATAKTLGISLQKARQWEHRFLHHGMTGLSEARDRGKPERATVFQPKTEYGYGVAKRKRKTENAPSSWYRLRNKFAASSVLRAMLHGFITVAGLTLLAKAVSFFKDADVVRRFGVSDDLDAYAFAFGVHTFTIGMLGGGIPNSFLPAYAVLQHEQGQVRAERLAIQTFFSHAISLIIVGAVIYVLGPQIIGVLGKGFPPPKQELSLHLLRALLPFMFCYGLSMHLAMWLRANKLFMLAAATPVVTPAAILIALVAHGGQGSITTLVEGTNVGGILQLLVLGIALAKRFPQEKGWLTSCYRTYEPSNRGVIASAFPFVISGLVLGGAPIIDQAMATQLESGSVTVLSYSDKICGIILALTASAAAEALFPFFADVVARRNWLALKRQLLHTIGLVLAIALPLVALLFWQAPLVVKLLFERGSFTSEDTERVAAVLRCAALQIPFYIASLLMSKVVIALQANWFTLTTAIFSLAGNFFFNIVLMRWYGVAGIALSTAVVYALSTLILYVYLMRTVKRLTHQDAGRRLVA
ncbi:MAG: putative peptidoglycan lipid flippase [Verrucomicrobiaceae bacterium]|nr:putative peptidoglycan lipid flippase [Verrucomicrobiaceae bacterium]